MHDHMSAQPPSHHTKTELALRVLRERIHGGQLKPGARLQVGALKDELGMSPTPIREALRLLQADRLVHYEPHHGVVVARLALDRLSDVYDMRLQLEPLATRLAVERMDPSQSEVIEVLHSKMVAIGRAGGGARSAKINSDWHWAIYRTSGSDMLQEFIQRLWSVFPWRTNWALDKRSVDSVLEHEVVMASLRAGDAAGAEAAMRSHIEAGSASEQPHHSTAHATDEG